MKFLSDKIITFVLSIAIAALIAVLVIFFVRNKKTKSTSDIVTYTQNVLQKSDYVLLDMLHIENGVRGYLLTVNEIFLNPLIKAETTVHTNLSSLTTITQNSANQQVRIDSLKKLVEKRLVLAKNMVAEKRQNRLSELEIINNLEKGKIITDQIEVTIAAIKAEEFGLLRNRKIENELSNKNSDAIFFVLLSFLFAIVVLVALIIQNQKNRNNELEVFTSSQNSLSNYARSLIEASLDPLVTISTAGKILDVNEASVKVTGIPREKLIDTDFSNYFTEPNKAQEGYRQVFEKGFVADYPLTIKHKNGNLTDVLYNASVYKDDKGNVLGVFAAARDFTEQKKVENILKESEEKYRTLLTSIDQGFTLCEIIRNKEGKAIDFYMLEVNPTYEEQTGISKETVLGKRIIQTFPSLTKLMETYAAVVDNQCPVVIENYFEDTDRWFENKAYPVGKDKFAVLFRDITEQKKSSLYARSLIETSLDPLVTISATGKILDVNEASVKVTGVPREKLIDTDFSDYFTEPNKAQEGYRQVFEKGFVADYPLTIKHKNGNLTDVLYNASVYKDDKGNVLGVFAAARDVTEQKWAKDLRIAYKELAFQNDEKEKKAAELVIANKELEAFTYVSSHDLQEPLRKIQTFVGRILEKENQNLSDNGKVYFGFIQNSAERMQALIQDLLAFSRLSMADRKFETTDLTIIVEEIKNEFKDAITEKNAVIEIEEICEVKVIPFQFRQLMHNLISNALKFSNPKIPPHIKISSVNINSNKINVANIQPEKEYCHITISDNGIGFEKEFSEKIFEVFQKLHSKDEYAGTGIGLAIVKKIVDNHNGIIIATSELNKGTRFDIYIPH